MGQFLSIHGLSINTKKTTETNKILDNIIMEYNPILSIGLLENWIDKRGLPKKLIIAKCSK